MTDFNGSAQNGGQFDWGLSPEDHAALTSRHSSAVNPMEAYTVRLLEAMAAATGDSNAVAAAGVGRGIYETAQVQTSPTADQAKAYLDFLDDATDLSWAVQQAINDNDLADLRQRVEEGGEGWQQRFETLANDMAGILGDTYEKYRQWTIAEFRKYIDYWAPGQAASGDVAQGQGQPASGEPIYNNMATGEPIYNNQNEPIYNNQAEPIYNNQNEPIYNNENEPIYNNQAGTAAAAASTTPPSLDRLRQMNDGALGRWVGGADSGDTRQATYYDVGDRVIIGDGHDNDTIRWLGELAQRNQPYGGGTIKFKRNRASANEFTIVPSGGSNAEAVAAYLRDLVRTGTGYPYRDGSRVTVRVGS
jgi:hypothetical protein